MVKKVRTLNSNIDKKFGCTLSYYGKKECYEIYHLLAVKLNFNKDGALIYVLDHGFEFVEFIDLDFAGVHSTVAVVRISDKLGILNNE